MKIFKFFLLGSGFVCLLAGWAWLFVENSPLRPVKKKPLNRLQSPCRPISFDPLGPVPKKTRIEKLNHLMKEPLDWLIKDIQGEVIDFYCVREKKILILNFWATWCPPCVQELSSLSQLATLYKEDIFIVAISSENMSQINTFLERSFSGDLGQELKFASVKAEEQERYFPKDKLPVTYIFDKQGYLKMKETGYRDWLDPRLIQALWSLKK